MTINSISIRLIEYIINFWHICNVLISFYNSYISINKIFIISYTEKQIVYKKILWYIYNKLLQSFIFDIN